MNHHKCEKLLDNGNRQCNALATYFYQSETTGATSARCEAHEVIPYKPELGRLIVLKEEEFLARRCRRDGPTEAMRTQGTMIVIYTYDFEKAVVIERTCEVFGYPNHDSSGATQYDDNTHFRTYDEALAKLQRKIEASLEIGARSRTDLRSKYERCTTMLADDAERLVAVKNEAERRKLKPM